MGSQSKSEFTLWTPDRPVGGVPGPASKNVPFTKAHRKYFELKRAGKSCSTGLETPHPQQHPWGLLSNQV